MSEWDSNRGFSGAAFDRQVVRSEQSPLEKVKEQYWTAKQVVLQKLGKKEDDHLIASDAELDAKLELFGSIKESSALMKRIACRYQKVMHDISREEYALGQFLKRHADQDSSRSGEMMQNVAKAFVISAQKRMEARVPLIRLAQDASTYQRCAVTDTEKKITQMEETRTEYRGALLWMKNISEELDPDTYRQLEKFRKVQHQVRQKKEKFDSQKLDTLQKIDLLAISRLNMLSQSLSPYGTVLFDFFDKSRIVFESIPLHPVNPNDAEKRIAGITIGNSPSTDANQDASLLDLSGDTLDAMWKESGMESGNFDLLTQTDLFVNEDLQKKDSPDGDSLFKFSDLDEADKETLDFLGDVLTPKKEKTEKPSSKDSLPSPASFFPSQLLRKGWNSSTPPHPLQKSPVPQKSEKPKEKSEKPKEKAASNANPNQNWYNLFADLDPLASGNSDAAKRTDGKQVEDNC